MSPRRQEDELQFVWSAPRADDPIETSWKQLERGMRRIETVEDLLRSLPGRRQTDRAIHDLSDFLENYFVRVYELRERAIALASRILERDIGKEARSRRLRQALPASIPAELQVALAPFLTMLESIDDDVKVRNSHTHLQFLTIKYGIPGADLYDPIDILYHAQQHEDQERYGIPLNRLMRRAVKRLSTAYAERARNAGRETYAFLSATRIFRSAKVPPSSAPPPSPLLSSPQY